MSLIGSFVGKINERLDAGIDRDENVIFYPSLGLHLSQGNPKIEIRGRIFEERRFVSDLTGAALKLAGVNNTNALDELLGPLADQEQAVRLFKERIRHFLLDGERREQFDIDVAGQKVTSPQSDSQGFFGIAKPWFSLPAAAITTHLQGNANPWVKYSARSNDGSRSFAGTSKLLQGQGVTVVSDIDDTIKDSDVPHPKELLVNTLFRPFRHTPGMPETYRAWEQKNAQFIYLTNSPYQLFEPLHDYLQGVVRYPEGAYYMRHVGLDDLKQSIDKLLAVDSLIRNRENPKKHNLIPILEAFPRRKFVLVGDSTESDAEIYVDLYQGKNFPEGFKEKAYADRIERIYIRDVQCPRREAAVTALARIGNAKVARFFDAQNPDILNDVMPLL